MSEPGDRRRPARGRPAKGAGRSAGVARRSDFARLVGEAMSEIPEPFRSKLENVAVVIEAKPSPRQLAELGMADTETLLGLYEGIPLTQRGEWYNLVPPDKITLFRQPILALCRTEDEVRAQVKTTVLHEVAHFYGIDDDELDRMGYA